MKKSITIKERSLVGYRIYSEKMMFICECFKNTQNNQIFNFRVKILKTTFFRNIRIEVNFFIADFIILFLVIGIVKTWKIFWWLFFIRIYLTFERIFFFWNFFCKICRLLLISKLIAKKTRWLQKWSLVLDE